MVCSEVWIYPINMNYLYNCYWKAISSICCCITVFLQPFSSNPRCGSLYTHTWVTAALPPCFFLFIPLWIVHFSSTVGNSKLLWFYFVCVYILLCLIVFIGLVNRTSIACIFKGNTEFQEEILDVNVGWAMCSKHTRGPRAFLIKYLYRTPNVKLILP